MHYLIPKSYNTFSEIGGYLRLNPLSYEKWVDYVETGSSVLINKENISTVDNTDAYYPSNFYELEYDKIQSFLDSFEKQKIEMPIIWEDSQGFLELLTGNTTLTGLMRFKGEALCWKMSSRALME